MKNIRLALIPALAGLVVLTACGGPDWKKPDASDASLHRDRADCKVKAQQADDDNVFQDCMKGRGWVEE